MTVSRNLLRGGVVVGLGQLAQQFLLFLRNVAVARLLLPEQFGIALSLATVITALDAVTELGIDFYLLRTRTESDVELQNTLHHMLIVRGCVTGAIIFFCAGGIAAFFKVPEMAWIYRSLAIVPFIRGFVHLDLRRFERDLHFRPNVISTLLSVAAGTITAIVVAWAFRSVGAILWAYIIQSLVLVIASHVRSERTYGIRPHRNHMLALVRFGMPLILNGTLILLLVQGDRALIGSTLGLVDLARYGVVSVLALGISSPVLRILGSVFLPVLARHKHGDAQYWSSYATCGTFVMVVATGLLIGFSGPGPGIIRLLFGKNYNLDPMLVTLIGIQTAFKILRAWPQALPIASGDTKLLPQANLVSALGLGTAALLLWGGHGNLVTVALCVMLSEIAAALYSIVTISTTRPALQQGLAYFFGLCLLAGVACLMAYLQWQPAALWLVFIVSGLAWAAISLAILRTSRQVWTSVCTHPTLVQLTAFWKKLRHHAKS